MFFTKAGKVFAWLAVASGMSGAAVWAFIASSTDPRTALQRVDLNEFLLVIVIGVALGILAEISATLAPKQ